MKMDGVTLLAVVAIAAFAVERITKAILFLLQMSASWRRRVSDERRQQIAYYAIAGVLAIGALAGYGNVRVLNAVGVDTNPYFDALITGLILVAGSDRVGDLLKTGGRAGQRPAEPPIQISGTLVLEDSAARRGSSQIV